MYRYGSALARGRRPHVDGHLTLLDVRVKHWHRDPNQRFLVKPKVVSWLRDCWTSDDPTFPRKLGRLCGARAMHVVEAGLYKLNPVTDSYS